jgi:hypothetical protein
MYTKTAMYGLINIPSEEPIPDLNLCGGSAQ